MTTDMKTNIDAIECGEDEKILNRAVQTCFHNTYEDFDDFVMHHIGYNNQSIYEQRLLLVKSVAQDICFAERKEFEQLERYFQKDVFTPVCD